MLSRRKWEASWQLEGEAELLKDVLGKKRHKIQSKNFLIEKRRKRKIIGEKKTKMYRERIKKVIVPEETVKEGRNSAMGSCLFSKKGEGG